MMSIKRDYYTYIEAQAVTLTLGINTVKDYKSRYHEDPKLPCYPNRVYANSGWIDWYSYLGKKRPDYFSSYADAQRAAQALGIKSQSDYHRRYREDPKLPPAPNLLYSGAGWVNWHSFLGKEKSKFYRCYTEAQAAAQALGIKNKPNYSKRYSEDPRLPSNPERVYAGAGWTDWYAFLGNKRPNYYDSYAEAQAAAQALGIKNQTDYNRRYREDPKLSPSPHQFYRGAGWTGWHPFLGKEKFKFYRTYAEAQAAARALGIKNQPDYQKRYSEDPKLPANPKEVYADAGWTNWYAFLGNEAPYDAATEYPNIWGDLEQWLEHTLDPSKKKNAIRALLANFFREQDLPDDSRYFLLRTNPFNSEAYQQFIENQATSLKAPTHRICTAFFEWLLHEYCTDDNSHERVVLAEYRNPLSTVLAGFADSLSTYRPSESTKAPLGYEYILRARQFLVPNGEQVMQTRPCLKGMPHLQTFFSSRGDWITVDESAIDRLDPNCVWRIAGKRGRKTSFQIWSPVRFIALYTLLRYPLRGQQILWLDSGEADSQVAVLDTENGCLRWEENTGPLTGKGNNKQRPQAAIQRSSKDKPKFYVTTNKTGRAEGGYEVEWLPDDLVYWLILLRDWQAKYNPLSAPTNWSAIGIDRKINSKILRARGSQCFLFRVDASGTPISTNFAFAQSFPALLYQIQRKGESLAIQDPEWPERTRYLSPYTPHCLRVSLITAFVIDGEAPIAIISKLVGHSSLVMTIYYTKVNSRQMTHAIKEAEKRAEQLALEAHAETIRKQGLQSLRHQLIATDGNRFLFEADRPNSACVVFDHGVCPMSACACEEGGKPLVEDRKNAQNIYGPVEAGYLGKKTAPGADSLSLGYPSSEG